MFQNYYSDRVPEQVATVFGSKFALALFQLTPGTWHGPIESGLGWHLVWVEALTPRRVPAFEEIEAEAKAEWIAGQRVESRRRAFEAMRARYEVILPTRLSHKNFTCLSNASNLLGQSAKFSSAS